MSVKQKSLHVTILVANREFVVQVRDAVAKAQSHPAGNGYFFLEAPIAFRLPDDSRWYLRKIKSVEAYVATDGMKIVGAGTRDLSSNHDDEVKIDLDLRNLRSYGDIEFTS